MTPIATKCELIEEFVRGTSLPDGSFTYPEIAAFVRYNDLGVPLAQAREYGLAFLTDAGEEVVEATWVGLCRLLVVDPEGTYEKLEDLLNG